MKRRLLASLSVLFILSSINAQVFAADSSLQEITFNEYYSAIQDRYYRTQLSLLMNRHSGLLRQLVMMIT